MDELNSVDITYSFKQILKLITAVRDPKLKDEKDDALNALMQLKVFFDNLDMLVREPENIPHELRQRYELMEFGACPVNRPSTADVTILP
jgi:hypothetical protein